MAVTNSGTLEIEIALLYEKKAMTDFVCGTEKCAVGIE